MPARPKGKNLVTRRPAESSAVTIGAIVTVIAYAFNITDAKVLSALPVVIGFVPFAITWFFAQVRGEG